MSETAIRPLKSLVLDTRTGELTLSGREVPAPRDCGDGTFEFPYVSPASVLPGIRKAKLGPVVSVRVDGPLSVAGDISWMFYSPLDHTLRTVDLSGLDTSAVTNMSFMFSGNRALSSVNLAGIDTANVTEMRDMFSNCMSLTSLDLTGFDTRRVRNTQGMFYACKRLASVTVSDETFRFPVVDEWYHTDMWQICPARIVRV